MKSPRVIVTLTMVKPLGFGAGREARSTSRQTGRPLEPPPTEVSDGRWRRERDSNPRAPFGANGFQDRRLKPLGHPSGCAAVQRILMVPHHRKAKPLAATASGDAGGAAPAIVRAAARAFAPVSSIVSPSCRP